MSCGPDEARARRRDLEVRPVPTRHVVLVTLTMIAMGVAGVAYPEFRGSQSEDPWALAELKLSPLHLGLGVAKGGVAPDWIGLDRAHQADIDIIQTFTAFGGQGPPVRFEPGPHSLTLGGLPACRGGTQVLTILEVRASNAQALKGFSLTAGGNLDPGGPRPQALPPGLCVLVGFGESFVQ